MLSPLSGMTPGGAHSGPRQEQGWGSPALVKSGVPSGQQGCGEGSVILWSPSAPGRLPSVPCPGAALPFFPGY